MTGESILLTRYHGEFCPPEGIDSAWFETHRDLWRVGGVVDLETTGRNPQKDKIIEIGLRPFRFHRQTGQVLWRDSGYQSFQDPGVPLPEEIIRITGITDAMVSGQSIDWNKVGEIFESLQLIIAHNAAFDCPFLDRVLPISSQKIWACSFKHIDWSSKGFPSQKLEILSLYHGFYCDAHRALEDSDALLHLLQMPDPNISEPYLAELLRNARRTFSLVLAVNSPFETKDKLRERGYRWDSERKVWNKLIYTDECAAEVGWLTEQVYSGRFRGVVKELSPTDSFKPIEQLNLDL